MRGDRMGKRSLANFAKNMALIAAVHRRRQRWRDRRRARIPWHGIGPGPVGASPVPPRGRHRLRGRLHAVSPDVFACVSLIAETLATLDLDLDLYVGDGDKRRKLEEAPMNPAERWDRPNAHDDEYTFGEALAANLMTFGNGYILKDRMGVAGPPRGSRCSAETRA